MKRTGIFSFCMFLCTLAPIYGQKPLALVVFSKGNSSLTRAGKGIPMKAKTLLQAGDTIKTGAGAKISVQFSSGVISQIAEKTVITIDSLKKSGGNVSAALSLGQGSMAMNVAKQGSGGSIQITTPTSVAGVRGTEFIVDTNGQSTEVLVNEGAVAVSTPSGKEEIAEPGHKVIADAKGLRSTIMKAFEKRRFEIMEKLRKSRQKNLEALIEQLRKNKELLETMKKLSP